MALSKTTQDHDEIRAWAEARGGKPADVASTERNGETGIIRIEFPGAVHANDSALKEISWEEFFEKFDASGLALVYQEETADGATSNFNKLVHPDNGSPSAKKAPAKKSTSGAKKAVPAVKTSTTSSKKGAQAKSAGPAKKVVAAAKKSVPAKKSAPATKKAPAKTSAPAKKSVSAKKAVPKTPAKKASSAKGTRR